MGAQKTIVSSSELVGLGQSMCPNHKIHEEPVALAADFAIGFLNFPCQSGSGGEHGTELQPNFVHCFDMGFAGRIKLASLRPNGFAHQ